MDSADHEKKSGFLQKPEKCKLLFGLYEICLGRHNSRRHSQVFSELCSQCHHTETPYSSDSVTSLALSRVTEHPS